MEGDYPYSYDDIQLRQKVKEGNVKSLTKKRSPELITLYESMKKIVYFFILFLIVYYLFILFYYSIIFIFSVVLILTIHIFFQDPTSRPSALELLSDPLIFNTIITHNLPIL
jgi:fatty acid desaturase